VEVLRDAGLGEGEIEHLLAEGVVQDAARAEIATT